MPAPRTDWTVEMLHDLPDDGNRYEIIGGVLLVSPSPSAVHQRTVGKLYMLIAPYLAALGLEEPEILFTPLEWRPAAAASGLRIDLVTLFREAHGEWP